MKIIGLTIASLFLTSIATAADKNFDDLNNSLGALSRVIQDRTQVAGEQQDKKEILITPPAEDIYKDLNGDLNNCQTIEIVKPEIVEVDDNGTQYKVKKFHIKVDGPQCPLWIEASVDTQTVENHKTAGLVIIKIIAKDPNLIKKMNLKNAEISGTVLFEVKQVNTAVNVVGSIKMSASGENSLSEKFGQDVELKFLMDMDMNFLDPSKFKFDNAIEMGGKMFQGTKVVDMYSNVKVGTSGMSQDYKINGQAVSTSEFQQYMQGLMIANENSNPQQNDQSPDGRILSSCSMYVFEKSKISQDQLKIAMTNNTVNFSNAIYAESACGQNVNKSFSHNGKTFNNQISFDENWITYSSDILTAQEATAIYLLYKDEAPQTTETDEFTIGFSCQPVFICP